MIGVLKGSDATLAAEAVVFSAHYDAFGVMRDAIFNGAADNAIGVAKMLFPSEVPQPSVRARSWQCIGFGVRNPAP